MLASGVPTGLTGSCSRARSLGQWGVAGFPRVPPRSLGYLMSTKCAAISDMAMTMHQYNTSSDTAMKMGKRCAT
eukprot:6054941-Lingulodinium_polyedra.AAC.1